jgi:hypothetical protein
MWRTVVVGVGVDVGREIGARQLVVTAQPVDHGARVIVAQATVELGAVAGREDRRLGHRGLGTELVQRLGHPLRGEGDPFADVDRRRLVVDSQSQQ